ncbi:MAG: MlaD family protein [Planctomycetota bacterium]
MQDTRVYKTKHIVIGLLLIACVIGVGVAWLNYIRAGSLWKRRQDMLVVFENIGSLKKDSPVRYNGVEKGRVKAMRTLHLDSGIIEAKFPVLVPRDLDNLPIRSAALKRELLALQSKDFNAACRNELIGATMIELTLDLLDENDPIRYHENDAVRIVSTIFGDSAVEIVSGSYEMTFQPVKPKNYIIGNSGDFEANLQKSMVEMKKILTNVAEVVGTSERASFGRALRRYTPLTDTTTGLTKSAPDRVKHTVERFSELTITAKDRLNKTGKVLESIIPSAETATKKVQAALKDIQQKTVIAENEAQAAMKEISLDVNETRTAVTAPLNTLTTGLSETKLGLLQAKEMIEKAPARLDAAMDALGSMQSQSTDDMRRFSEAAQKILLNLKIAGYVATNNKDLMLANRDTGEHVAQTALDIRRKLAMVTRRMTNAGADTRDAIRALENNPAVDTIIDPVKERADESLKRLTVIRDSLAEILNSMDETMYVPWSERKRAAWFGDGPVRWTEGGR